MKIIKFIIKLRKWVWSPLLSFVEKVSYPKLYRKGKNALKKIQDTCLNVDEYVKYIQREGFYWVNDPIFGILDFTSCAEITASKKRGDCDDFARLACTVLKDRYQEIYEVYCFAGAFSGHVMALFYDGNKWQLISNELCIYESFSNDNVFEMSARAFYGSQLKYYHIERIK